MNATSGVFRLMLFALVCLPLSGLLCQYQGGSGTTSDPYQISTPAQLDSVRLNPNAHFVLINDIDMGVAPYNVLPGFDPIGTYFGMNYSENVPFTGSFDGSGHIISNLMINRQNENCVGLFSLTANARITGIKLTNLFIWGGTWMTGGISGLDQGSTIRDCSISGVVAGETRVGGMVGWAKHTSISHCNFSYLLWSHYGLTMGCMIGFAEDSDVDYCDASGNITGFSQIGGLVGESARTKIRNCSSLCTFTTYAWTGGLVGLTYDLGQSIINSYYDYDLALFNDRPRITPGALIHSHFQEWLAQDRQLDVSDELTCEDGVYLVQSLADFRLLWALGEDHSRSFRLTADLDLSSSPELCIPYFTGHFDGDGHTISGLSLSTQQAPQKGLFSHTEDALIENLRVVDCTISGGVNVGVISGVSCNSTIRNCTTSGIIDTNASSCGGIVGLSYYQTLIDQCSSYVNIDAGYSIGGLVGVNRHSDVYRCFFQGTIIGSGEIGGLVGRNTVGGRISESYACCYICGDTRAAGIAFLNEDDCTIVNCYCSAPVNCPAEGAAMVVFTEPDDMHNCYWNTDVCGQADTVGGSGRTTDQMTFPFDANTYSGWDFTGIWTYDPQGLVNSGFPYLRGTPVSNADTVLIPSVDPCNYPNPFNPSTTIRFSLPESGMTELCIYNLKGQRVRCLVNGNLRSGNHDIVWDGKDSHGTLVSSGVYLYRLTYAGKTITRRMTFIK